MTPQDLRRLVSLHRQPLTYSTMMEQLIGPCCRWASVKGEAVRKLAAAITYFVSITDGETTQEHLRYSVTVKADRVYVRAWSGKLGYEKLSATLTLDLDESGSVVGCVQLGITDRTEH